jgi:dihydroorotate dehydrogenase
MNPVLDLIARRALFMLDPETAHRLSVAALTAPVRLAAAPAHDPALAVSVAGIDFPNPLGIAAGYDKNARVPDALLGLGFGFAEVGTVTPRPQEGNPKPRIFRLEEDAAVINRLGFNNEGHEAVAARLEARKALPGIVGINIGANKDAVDRIADFAEGVRRFAHLGSYLAINISSPNTPGLRDLQGREQLAALLSAVRNAREDTVTFGGRLVPVFLKIAPDLSDGDLEDIAEASLLSGIDGLIVSNTTLSRAGVTNAAGGEAGGLSGRPLFERSTIILARMRQLVGPAFPIIGVGGVDSAETALAKVMAGADLVQLYTGFIYGGPGLPGTILRELGQMVRGHAAQTIGELRDLHTADWAARPLD